MMICPIPYVAGVYGGAGYPPALEFHIPAPIGARPPLLPIPGVGTGGIETEAFYRQQIGYRMFDVVEALKSSTADQAPVDQGQFADMMREIKNGFGRTMSRLPEVFGVSRQTLYNWLDGDTPKPSQQARLRQLARAARMFTEVGFKPNSLALDRTVSQGKSLLQLLSEGADGRETAKKLVRIIQRGVDSRSKLDELLGGRKIRLEASDIGAPSLDEIS
jgi:hypothetical protein